MEFLKGWLKDLFFAFNSAPAGERASILSYHNIGVDGAFFYGSAGRIGQAAFIPQSTGQSGDFPLGTAS